MQKNNSVLTYYDDESPWTTALRRLARNIKYSGYAKKRLSAIHPGARYAAKRRGEKAEDLPGEPHGRLTTLLDFHGIPEIGNGHNYHRAITGPVVETTGYSDTDDVLMGDALKKQHESSLNTSRRVGSRWLLEDANLLAETQHSLSAEADYEATLPNIQHRGVEEVEIPEIKSILITSSVAEEGKSLISANLSITMAKDEPDKEILLVDSDMRKPKQHELFAIEKEPGLSSILTGKASLSESIYQSELENLWIIPSGAFVQSPPRLLSSPKARELIKACSDFFDMVVIDAPPIIPVNDPAVIAPYVDGVLLVVMAKRTFRETIQKAIEFIEAARANFLGIVLNKVDIKRGGDYYSYGYKGI